MNRTSSFLDMKKNNEKRSSKLGQYDKKGVSVKIKRGETHTSQPSPRPESEMISNNVG